MLAAAGIDVAAPGVIADDEVDKEFVDTVLSVLGLHRVWERADLVMASDVPPAGPTRHAGC